MSFSTAFAGSDWAVPVGLLQGPGPDSPFSDLLGYILVFFVIVWPILRGILESARGQRKEFEAKQSKGGPGGAPQPRRKRTLEEILEGKLERADVDVPRSPVQPEAVPVAPSVSRAPVIKGPAPSARFGERPVGEGSAPVYRDNDLHGGGSTGDLVGDPFDESSMELDLVPDTKLRHIPTEGEIEAGNASSGTQARGGTAVSVANQPRGGAARAAAVSGPVDSDLVRDDPEVLFRRLGQPLTPWQKAFVLREVLGAPLASRPSPTLTDLPE